MNSLSDPPTELEIAELNRAVSQYFFEPQIEIFRRLMYERRMLTEENRTLKKQLEVANEHIKQLQILTKPKSLFR